METKENLLHLFWNCNLVKQFWFAVKNLLMICGIAPPLTAREITLALPLTVREITLALPLTEREITLGISESYIENQKTVNNIL